MLQRSIAQRMSWASRRETTRSEDIAYCLMGIFDVNMPLLYGEGTKAFVRLQEEILKRSYDYSLFAWTTPKPDCIYEGFLAASPSYFQHSNHYVFRNSPTRMLRLTQPCSMTNMGLCIDVPLFHVPGRDYGFIAVLLCGSTSARNSCIGLPVSVYNIETLLRRDTFMNFDYFTAPSMARRDSHRGLIALKVAEFGFGESVPWTKVEWNARSLLVKAYVSKLYIPQETIYEL
jgi:hypothetical protein